GSGLGAWRISVGEGEGDDDTGLAAASQAALILVIDGGEHGSVTRDEFHEATGVHAGAVRELLQPLCRATARATAAHAGPGAPAIRSGHGGGVHAGRGADPARGMEDSVLRLPGAPRRGLRRAPLRQVLPRRVTLPPPAWAHL